LNIRREEYIDLKKLKDRVDEIFAGKKLRKGIFNYFLLIENFVGAM